MIPKQKKKKQKTKNKQFIWYVECNEIQFIYQLLIKGTTNTKQYIFYLIFLYTLSF